MGEINIKSALDSIESGGSKERSQGLHDLTRILRHNERNIRQGILGDVPFLRIFDCLFRVSSSERSAYLKSLSSTSKSVRSTSSSRLSACSSTLRIAVDVAVPHIKGKTLRALIDYFIENFLDPHGNCCEPVAPDYVRSLSSLLAYPPHAERLDQHQWRKVFDFCQDQLRHLTVEPIDDSRAGASPVASRRSGGDLSLGTSVPTDRSSQAPRARGAVQKQLAADFTAVTRHLLGTPSAPVTQIAYVTFSLLVGILETTGILGNGEVDTLACINHVLSGIRTEATSLVLQYASRLLVLARQLWDSKIHEMKHELLHMLILLSPFVQHAACHTDTAFDITDGAERLVEVLLNDYSRRPEKDQLLMADLDFVTQRPCTALSNSVFALHDGLPRVSHDKKGLNAEHCWSILELLSLYTVKPSAVAGVDSNEELVDVPRKRFRQASWIDELLRLAKDPASSARICALQLLTFHSQLLPLTLQDLSRILDGVIPLTGDKSASVASWAFMAITSCGTQTSALSATFSDVWTVIWQIASRALNVPSTCRVSCHLLRVMILGRLASRDNTSDLNELFRTSIVVNGPALCNDASCALLCDILSSSVTSRISDTGGLPEQILDWTFHKWSPANCFDRVTRSASTSSPVSAQNVLNLILACCSMSQKVALQSVSPAWGVLSQTWIQDTEDRGLLEYLLLIQRPSVFKIDDRSGTQSVRSPGGFRSVSLGCMSIALDLCTRQVHEAGEQWEEHQQSQRMTGLPTEAASKLAGLMFVAHYLIAISSSDKHRSERLRSASERLLTSFCAYMETQECESDWVDCVVETFSVRNAHSHGSRGTSEALQQTITALNLALSKALDSRRYLAQTGFSQIEGDDDMMDIDSNMDSQITNTPRYAVNLHSARRDLAAACCPTARRVSAMLYAKLLACQIETREANGSASSSFTKYLVSLSTDELLSSRSILANLEVYGMQLEENDVFLLFDKLSERVLDCYAATRSEVGIGLIIDVMTCTLGVWAGQTITDLHGLSVDFYEFLTGMALDERALSSATQKRLSELLLRLWKRNADYGQSEGMPSIRTTLFGILKEGSLVVKISLAERIPSIFSMFTLPNHEAVFDDLEATLPIDAEWLDGIAFRLYMLSNLASAWPSLLRKSIYHIFDTAGQVPPSAGHALVAVKKIARSHSFDGPSAVFKAFSSQLLFTWLRQRSLQDISHATFGYSTLEELCLENQDEIVAQLLLHDRKEDLQWLKKTLRLAEHYMTRSLLPKAVAYAVSQDISNTLGSIKSQACEGRVKATLSSKDVYADLLRAGVPTIVAQVLLSTHVEPAENSLGASANHKAAYDALVAIKSFGSSDRLLPPSMQPSFKGKHLTRQLNVICQRASLSMAEMFDKPRLTATSRILIENMHPALGSLHACSMLRRLRILVALAGENALQGYPLEMLLRAVRTRLMDAASTDDAVGLLKYLYDRSLQYLTENTGVLVTNGLLTLLALKSFMVAKTDSLTQESQYKTTLSAVHDFHEWTANYMATAITQLPEKTQAILQPMIGACRDASFPLALTKGRPGTDFLLRLIDDSRSTGPILQEVPLKEIVDTLLSNAIAPDSPLEALLGDDSMALEYASSLRKLASGSIRNDHVARWVGRTLGKAYNALGSEGVVTHPSLSSQKVEEVSKQSLEHESQKAIAAVILRLLAQKSLAHAACAERTLCDIFSRFTSRQDLLSFEQHFPTHVIDALKFADGSHQSMPGRQKPSHGARKVLVDPTQDLDDGENLSTWTKRLADMIVDHTIADPILSALPTLLHDIEGLAEELMPFLIHLALAGDDQSNEPLRLRLCHEITELFNSQRETAVPKIRILLRVLIYLLKQPMSREHTRVDRQHWLEIDFTRAAKAASTCGMPTTALFLVEHSRRQQHQGPARLSRRSSTAPASVSPLPSEELMLQIYERLDDPDSYYGVDRDPSLSSVLERVDQEGDGLKSLTFHTANLDASMRIAASDNTSDAIGMLKALGMLDLNSLTYSLLQNRQRVPRGNTSVATMDTARRLDQWDVIVPESETSDSAVLYSVQQVLRNSSFAKEISEGLDTALRRTVIRLTTSTLDANQTRSALQVLAVLAEVDEMTTCNTSSDMYALWNRVQQRQDAWDIGQSHELLGLLSHRETNFGILRRNIDLCQNLHLSSKDALLLEIQAVISNSTMSRKHGLMQRSMAATAYLSALLPSCAATDLRVDAVAQHESANILWEQNEMSTSVKILQKLSKRQDLDDQAISVGRAGILAQLGHQVAAGRLQRPEEVIAQYLEPAIAALNHATSGLEAGRVFHEFAAFCDQQLQNPDSLEDFRRIQSLRNRKLHEAKQLEALYKFTPKNQESRKEIGRSLQKATQWYKLDDEEYKRAVAAREEFTSRSLDNYLKALTACDDYDTCVLRFFTLWLENAGSLSANDTVGKQLDQVASWKFAVLLNQVMSRLLDQTTQFQKLLTGLLRRICAEHPYHSIHHIFASSHSAVSESDESAISRREAARKIGRQLHNDKKVGALCKRVWEANIAYNRLATVRIEKPKNGKLSVAKVPEAAQMNTRISQLRVPPATLHLELRPTGDYGHVPVIARFRDEMSIATGLSAPKILTARASDGNQYRQLFKGGNDDLRQDAIMEQVFGEVSNMLRKHKETRRRNLHIRTYKVLPLSSTSGIIEFVSNSIPLQEYLEPAHTMYHPSDIKFNKAREVIREAQNNAKAQRVATYRNVTSKYTPVLRYFFFERFEDPDEWFARRLAYTRTTAAISMLGYVLGLGDRHCHNILLDEKSGEVIHIDLGVAFETGRVLPVPEVVPFRLTRDVVDGMGITGTEGVFRRCCEFTMEALRQDKDSIMTLLNVLRYDPLYSWTVSPLRAKRMQEAQEESKGAGLDGLENTVGGGDGAWKNVEDEASEAERALAVVEKKLSKTLSTAATVNELIQQATDERNLAVLFAGWAAFS